jgi:hypothetical protein
VNDAHAPLADLLAQLVRPNSRAGAFRDWPRSGRLGRFGQGSLIEGRVADMCRQADIIGFCAVSSIEWRVRCDEIVELALGLVVCPQQRLHTESERGVRSAFAVEESRSRCEVFLFSGRQKQGLHALRITRMGWFSG